MSIRKNQNSILVLATLGVYLGLVLVGATPQVLAQRVNKDEPTLDQSGVVLNKRPLDPSTSDQSGIYINVRPTKDLAFEASQKLENKEVVLDAPFRITITGTLGLAKDGKTVILTGVKRGPLPDTGDPAMIKLAAQCAISLADAGWFGYLDKLGSKTVVVTFEQNDQTVIARVTADQASEQKARAAARSFTSLLQMAVLQAKADELIVLRSTTAGSDGKSFFVNFEMPKQAFAEMIQRKIAVATAQVKTPPPDRDTYLDRNGVYINRRPTKELAVELIQKLNARQIVLDTAFRATITGTMGLGKDGKTVILENPRPVSLPNANMGEPEMMKFAQHALIAFADSGWLGYIDKFISKNVVLMLEQTEHAVMMRLTVDQPDPSRARASASIINALLKMAAPDAPNADTKRFLQSAGAGIEGNMFVVNFELPKQVFTEMVQRKLSEAMITP